MAGSGLLIGAIILIKALLHAPVFSGDFTLGLIFWPVGWAMVCTELMVSFNQRFWRLGGAFPLVAYRRLDAFDRESRVRTGTRVGGWVFAVIGWLLITRDLWR